MKALPRILVFSNFYLPGFKGGGPIRTVFNMVKALDSDFLFFIVASDRDLGDHTAYTGIIPDSWVEGDGAHVLYLSPRAWKVLWREISIFDGKVLYLNSYFSFKFSIAPLLLWRLLKPGRPIVLGPRGEFSRGALEQKFLKKKIFLKISHWFGLHRSVIWHASSGHEADDIRRTIGLKAHIRTATDIAYPESTLTLKSRKVDERLRVVFLSRIAPMKNLLGALEMLRQFDKPLIFDIYGPVEDESYWVKCQSVMSALPSNITVNYRGSLEPMEVAKTLAGYDLFFLPTLGENFGHVIAEALSAGVPVLISDRTPWRDLKQKCLGWDIPLDEPDRFVECIEYCCAAEPENYDEWRAKIRAWALDNVGGADAVEQNRRLFLNLDEKHEQ